MERLGLALPAQVCVAELIGGRHSFENVVRSAPSQVVRAGHWIYVGEKGPGRIHGTYHNDTFGLPARRTPQQVAAHHAEHGRIHGNAQGQCENSRGCESGALDNPARSVTQVLEQLIQARQSAGFAMPLLGLLRAAETNQRLTPGLFLGHPTTEILFDGQIQVSCQFHFQVVIEMRATKNGAKTVQRLLEPVDHDCPPSSCMPRTRPTALDSLCQYSVSSERRLRPLFVME